jgi:hypothetical protein
VNAQLISAFGICGRNDIFGRDGSAIKCWPAGVGENPKSDKIYDVHHLLIPTRRKIFDIGMALSTTIVPRMIQCHRPNGCM